MSRTKKTEIWVDILETFAQKMKEKNFSTWFLDSQSMPKMICEKKNHYRFEMIVFLYPDPTISLSATVGTDTHSIMYFQLKNITENTWERFESMMAAAEQYIEYELLENKEDRREF